MAWDGLTRIQGGGTNNPAFPRKNLSERVAYILQAYLRYAPMSSNIFKDSKFAVGHPEVYGSVEDIHNSVHNATGGGGHMTDPAISAFDPIFWLHHASVLLPSSLQIKQMT